MAYPAKPNPRTLSRRCPSPPWRPSEPGYGVVEYQDGGRARFVAFGPLSVACLTELCAVARKHGVKPASTAGWLTQSRTGSEPKE